MAVARIAAAIGEPARARMLYSLMDGRARTSTELAVAADVSASTASAHLNRLKSERLVKALAQGKHRYYSLDGPNVASALEGLSVLAGGSRVIFRSTAPSRLRGARTCYDHMAGTMGVSLHDRLHALGWLAPDAAAARRIPSHRHGLPGFTGSGHRSRRNPRSTPAVCLRLPRLERTAPPSGWRVGRGPPEGRAETEMGDTGPGFQSTEHHRSGTTGSARTVRRCRIAHRIEYGHHAGLLARAPRRQEARHRSRLLRFQQ